jgi:hypothetical protein
MIAIPALIIIGVSIKQTWPSDLAPVQLEAPE